MARISGFTVPPLPRADWNQNEALARRATHAPRIPWDTFTNEYFKWEYGEHVGLIGQTGLGKTTLLINLLPLHRYVTVFATKPRDSVMQALIDSHGYLKMSKWQSLDPNEFPRRVLWPDATQMKSQDRQREVFEDALERMYREGGWTVALDETWYMDNELNLGRAIRTYLLQARSLGISLVAATQRPAWVPREIYTASTHLFIWRVNDETDLKSISGIGWLSSNIIRDIVANLDVHQVLYINTRTGAMVRTRCPEIRIDPEGRKNK
jgi:energy-coupling factor transporter ATP-binding protein EcfA2